MRHLLSLLLSITLPPQGMAVFHTKLTRLMVRTLSIFCLFFCLAARSHAQIIIYDENGFYNLNPVSGTKSLICPNPDQITGADIAISPAGDVYGFRQDPNDMLIYLVKINLLTGESTNVFKLPRAGTGFVISEDNIAYIAAGINFFSVDMNTGQVSALSLLPYSSGCSGDLIFHEDQLFVSTTSTTLTWRASARQ